jgi:hypothetical protein
MGRFAHVTLSASAIVSLGPRSGGPGGGNTVEYEKPDVESQVDVTGIMGWGGLPDKNPYS